MIIEHYEVFKTELESLELNKNNWELLRTQSNEKAYAIEDNIVDYEENCMKAVSYEDSAKCIIDVVERHGGKRIVTLGAGKGILEWHLKKKKPDLFIECTDYAEKAIDKLKKVFLKCDAFRVFDIMQGNYQVFSKDAFFIFYRVSEEFCFADWCKIFQKMKKNGIKNIIYIPDMLATDALAARMAGRHEANIKKKIQDVFCGWIYSEDVLEKMFEAGEYEVIEKRMAGELVLYLLKLNEKYCFVENEE